MMKRTGGNFRSRSAAAFTLAELSITMGIASVIALGSTASMVEGMSLFKCTSTEMIARDAGSRVIRRMTTAIQSAVTTKIVPNYLSTGSAGGLYGSCVVLQTASGTSAAFYRYAPNSDPNSGGIYYDANIATAPNPATDKLLASSAQDLEFRRDATGTIRAGFKIGTFGYPSKAVGAKEADRVRYTTSILPRN